MAIARQLRRALVAIAAATSSGGNSLQYRPAGLGSCGRIFWRTLFVNIFREEQEVVAAKVAPAKRLRMKWRRFISTVRWAHGCSWGIVAINDSILEMISALRNTFLK
jgi:hypothetical protein